MYKINLPANCFFLAAFSLSLLGFIGVAVYDRRAGRGRNTTFFTAVMCLGVLCEIIGYAARIGNYRNRGAEAPFMTQIVCLTVGPAFTAAGVYVCLRRIVEALGTSGSLIRPRWYTHGFIAGDAVSPALQGVGGGMASAAMRTNHSKRPGTRVMLAGMVFQVVTLFVFLAVAAHFACTTWWRHCGVARGLPGVVEADPATRRLRRSCRFRGFTAALLVSAVCLFWRCIFRVAELSEGWTGPLMKRQDLFIAFEGVMVAMAVLVLNLFHPALCMAPGPENLDDSDPEEPTKK